MANPRKFSEKIALQKQKQAEGTAEFEKIMKEVYATKMDETQANQRILECCLTNTAEANHAGAAGVNSSGSAGNGGGGGSGSGGSGGGASPEGTTGGGSGSPTGFRESRGRSVGVGPMRRPSERKQDRSPYGSSTAGGAAGIGVGGGSNTQNIAYLSPPMDSNWRRSNSDSALHQTLNMAVAAENFGQGGMAGLPADMNALHANYQHHNQRSHSPNIGRSFSPQAQKRKAPMMQHQQLHGQHQHMLQQHQQHGHQMQPHFQQQQHMQQQQPHHHQQQHATNHQQQYFNAKFTNLNASVKPLQDQAFGSLPDLTSARYFAAAQPQLLQQQQQQTLSPTLSPHNNGRERDQSPSPFSPPGEGGPPSPYHQPQHSPATSAANTPTAAQTSPHLSFTNLAVQSPQGTAQNTAQSGSFGTLPTLGAASSTGNLTDYRQPLNPPSPGSSPGLLTSVPAELHTSAPASPIRHPHTNMQQSMQGYNDKNIQTFDRYSPGMGGTGGGGGTGTLDGYSLNPSFHNHFEQFSLGDSNSSPEQQLQLQQHFQQQNDLLLLQFDDFVSGGSNSSQQPTYSHNLVQNKLSDFNDLAGQTAGRGTVSGGNSGTSNSTTTSIACNNNNMQQQQQQQQQHNARTLNQQQMLNNNGASSGANTNGPCHGANNNVNLSQQNDIAALRQDVHASPIPSPHGCGVPSPSSPLPIPISAQSPHHSHQLSLSLHSHSAQHSPHHSPLHSPHHASPISASSPGISTLGGVSPVPHAGNVVSSSTNAALGGGNSTHQQQQQQQQQQHQQSHHQQQQQQNHANTPTTTNIPSIIFSDYSSNSDFSREIFDNLDLDLVSIDAGLHMLADQNPIMITDPSNESGFRRDLN